MSERDDLTEQAFHAPVIVPPAEHALYKREVLGEWAAEEVPDERAE